MTRMKILILMVAVSSLTVLASCSSEAPIEVKQEIKKQEVHKAETYVIILTPTPKTPLTVSIDGND